MKLFPGYRFYFAAISCVLLFFLGYFSSFVFIIAKGLAISLLIFTFADIVLLFFVRGRIVFERCLPDRFSNGDENEVSFLILNRYPIEISLLILDELPVQFQLRNFKIELKLKSEKRAIKTCKLRPTERGEYEFGKTNVLANSRLGLIKRRFKFGVPKVVKVYPSFLNLKKYEILAISQSLKLGGQKRIKRIGQSTEFDHIKDYVLGDDPRYINWKASARKGNLMVNHYADEKSQPIYSVLNKGRPMKMPFRGMTLLDYAINASLVLSNVAIRKGDRAGLVTFQHKPETFIPALKRNLQINYLLETLYNQKTQFNEPDFATLYWFLMQNIKQRSLLLLYTNFESNYTLERQLPYLKMINRHHLLLLIFFRNTELDLVIEAPSNTTIDIYNKSIAKQIAYEKASIQKILFQNGILSLYVSPENLTINVINKYIEIKTKRLF